MRAAVARAGNLVVEQVDDPVPGRGQVLVESLANGICGSDLRLLESQRGETAPPVGLPVIPGHEFCARVVDHGPHTDHEARLRWPIGTVVSANPFTGNGWELIGMSADYPGGLAEFMVLPVNRLMRVPTGTLPEHAALAEPLAVGIRAVAAAAERSGTGPYLVIGCGPIGLAVILALRAAGRGPIIASEPSSFRRALAERLGADMVVSPSEDSPFAGLERVGFEAFPPSATLRPGMGSPRGAVVFDCVGSRGQLQHLIEAAPIHSHIVVVGVCHGPDQIVPVNAIVKELRMSFVLAYRPSEFEVSMNRIVNGTVDVSPLITATFGLDHAPDAVGLLERGDQAKVLVLPNAPT